MNGFELDEIHDVLITTPTNNQALIYESETDLWKNKTIGLQQILQNGDTATKGINVTPEEFTSGFGATLIDNTIGLGITTDTTINTTPITISNQNEEIFKVDSLGNVIAKALKKDGGLSTQFLMADGSTSTGGTPPINPFSILANNTSGSAIPTEKVYKEIAEQTLSGTGFTATGGTLPSGTQNHTYRWSQIGNLVTLRINLNFGTAGTCSGIAIPFANMPDIPQTPQHSINYNGNGDVSTYGSGSLSGTKGFPTFTSASGCSAIRKALTGSLYEVLVGRASSSYTSAWIQIQYYI